MTTSAVPARLFDKAVAPRFALLCLGIWLNAADTLVTATIMPSVANEIGGYQYFGWSVAAYLTGSIVAGACSGKLSMAMGLRTATALAGLVYAIGCAMSALAPEFVTFIAGRLIQGLGAGAVVALCYVAITALFPESLWPRVYGAVAGVWGAATLLGPLLGGLFAAAGFWRGAFWLFVVQAIIFIGAVMVMLPADRNDPDKAASGQGRIPSLQLALLVIGVSLIGAAGIVASPSWAIALAIGGVIGMAAMLAANTRTHDRLLPRTAADLKTATGLGLLTIFACEAAVIGFTVYGPAFIQALHHASPLTAGYVTGAIAAGWTLCAMLVGHTPAQKDGRLVRLGAGVILLGAILSAWAVPHGNLAEIALAFGVLGAGFGLCHAFIARRAIAAVPPEEQAMASGAVPTAQLIGGAAGSAGAGAMANVLGFSHGIDPTLAATHGLALFGAFLPLAVVGFVAAWRLGRN